jgi:hypothetical protein
MIVSQQMHRDNVSLRSDEQVGRKATERGLRLMQNGICLNSVGAELVAEAFLEAITS